MRRVPGGGITPSRITMRPPGTSDAYAARTTRATDASSNLGSVNE